MNSLTKKNKNMKKTSQINERHIVPPLQHKVRSGYRQKEKENTLFFSWLEPFKPQHDQKKKKKSKNPMKDVFGLKEVL